MFAHIIKALPGKPICDLHELHVQNVYVLKFLIFGSTAQNNSHWGTYMAKISHSSQTYHKMSHPSYLFCLFREQYSFNRPILRSSLINHMSVLNLAPLQFHCICNLSFCELYLLWCSLWAHVTNIIDIHRLPWRSALVYPSLPTLLLSHSLPLQNQSDIKFTPDIVYSTTVKTFMTDSFLN